MAGLQTVTTPVGGTAISSSAFGIPVANNLTVLANPPLAKMRNSTTQSIPNSTTTAVTWDTEDFDTVGGHSTSSNTSRYVAQAGYAGYYSVTAVVWFAGNATGVRASWLRVNGTDVAGTSDQIAGNAASMPVTVDSVVFLNAADYVEVVVSQNSGGALLTSNASTAAQSSFTVEWVHA